MRSSGSWRENSTPSTARPTTGRVDLLVLRGHPDEVLSYEEVKRYWKQPTRNVFVEQATS